MPQMKPLNWLYLYIMFLLITYIFMILNFFLKKENNLMINVKNFKKNKLIWKW